MPTPSILATAAGPLTSEIDKQLSSAGLLVGTVLVEYSRTDRLAPDYVVVDVEYISSQLFGAGGLIVFSKSGNVFAGGQGNYGSPGSTSAVRAGFIDGGPYSGNEVDQFLTGWSGSAAATVGRTSWAVTTPLTSDVYRKSYAYETGLASGVPLAVSVSGSFVLEDSATSIPGWGS